MATNDSIVKLNILLNEYDFNEYTMSEYLSLTVENLRRLAGGDESIMPKDNMERYKFCVKIDFLYELTCTDEDERLSAFLDVLMSYHGLSAETIAKIAGVDVHHLAMMSSKAYDEVPEDVKYKIAVAVMGLRFFLKDNEPKL